MHSDALPDNPSSRIARNAITFGFVVGAAVVVLSVRSEGESTVSSPTPTPPATPRPAVHVAITVPPPPASRPTWTYGSQKADVRGIEGHPDRIIVAGPREIWFYRRRAPHGFPVESHVQFDHEGKVESWMDMSRSMRANGHGMPLPPWDRR